MAVLFSPFGNQQFSSSGTALANGHKINTYAAGSSTPLATYTDSTGATAQSNPIILNSLGMPTVGQIWLTSGLAYKLVWTDASDVVIKTEDNITGVTGAAAVSQWQASGLTPTYVSATSFTLAGDQTSTFHVNRRLQSTNTAGTIYSTISSSAYTTLTTVTVVNDSGVLDSGLSQVNYSLLTATNSALPVASATTTGGVELATTAEVLTGTDTVRVPSVGSLRNGLIYFGTPVAATSGTAINFTGIPSWAKKVTVSFVKVSTNGTSPLYVQIGDSGGIETTGYEGSTVEVSGSATATFSDGFRVGSSTIASATTHGTLVLTLESSANNTWCIQGVLARGDTGQTYTLAGNKSLSATLDRVRITTSGGTDAFDGAAGAEINITAE